MTDLNDLTKYVEKFAEHHFPTKHDRVHHGLIVVEEAGEVARAVLKQEQCIRGTWEFWDNEIKKECAQAITAICGLAGHCGYDLEQAVSDHLEIMETMNFTMHRGPNS